MYTIKYLFIFKIEEYTPDIYNKIKKIFRSYSIILLINISITINKTQTKINYTTYII